MEQSLLYVSRRCRDFPDLDENLREIVHRSLARNAALDVTGALVATSDCFAQVLEGPAVSIDQLMASIRRDPRHCDIVVLDVIDIDTRTFHGWSMVYSGPSSFVARRIVPLMGERGAEDGMRIRLLRSLIREFAKVSDLKRR